MVPLYTLMLAGLGSLKWALGRRAAGTERKYVAAAHAAEAAAKKLQVKPGNGSADALAVARNQYELGRLVQERDALEAKYVARQHRHEAVGRKLIKFRNWNGRLVPYVLGVVDLGLVLAALHALGLPHGLTPDAVQEWAKALVK